MSNEDVLAVGGEQVPYFRTQEFSDIMLENERLMKEFVNAPNDAKAVFITGSGTASMEAVVMNVFTPNDKLLVIDGGSFGHRFTQLCDIHKIPYTAIRPAIGQGVKSEGELIISGTKGYVYVPAPWWKTDYFEVRYENQSDNKRFFYKLEGEGIRFEILSFIRQIENGAKFSYIGENTSRKMIEVVSDFYKGDFVRL